MSRQNGRSYAATNLAAHACRWRRSEVSRASLTPVISMSRAGPEGTASTTASARISSPAAVVTAHPLDAIAMRETGVARRTSDSPAAIVRATVADPSATRWFSHSSTS